MKNENKPERLPPYVSYKTWIKLVQGLVNFLPGVIDNSVFLQMKFSGTDSKRLRTALRYLNFIDDNGIPSEKIHNLLKAYRGETNKQEALRTIMKEAYSLLSDSSFDLAKATWKQLTDGFEKMGATGTIQRLSINFFLHMATEAEMEISPHLSSKAKSGYGRPSVVRKARQKRQEDKKAEQLVKPSYETKTESSLNTIDVDPSVAGVLYLLPRKGQKWDKGSKERFKMALAAILDAVYPNGGSEQKTS